MHKLYFGKLVINKVKFNYKVSDIYNRVQG